MSLDNKEALLQRVEAALDSVRPYLLADGGDVKVFDITDDLVVQLELLGSCQSCPMSVMTFKAGLEESILRAVPEITKVQAVNVASLA